MENGEHVSVDMEKLADNMSRKMESLHPLSGECSIYTVPEPKRGLHPSHYTPQVVSIGPLHYGKEEFKAMEEHKIRYLKSFLQRTKVRMARFFEIIKGSEAKLRNCYAETILLESDEFVTMVLVDAVFLIELFLRNDEPDLRTDDDRIFGKSYLLREIRYDLWRLENQLPLFILRDLFNLSKTATYGLYERISLEAITFSYFRAFIIPYIPVEENVLEINFSKAQHFRIFGKSRLYRQIKNDLWRLENQLPFFILRDLFNLAKTATHMGELYEDISLEAITFSYFSDFLIPYLPMEENVLEINFSKAQHFLDLIILSLHPSQWRPRTRLNDPKIPSAKTLHQAGINFKSGSIKDLLDINFNKGTLEIPFLPVYEGTESLYRNLLAFECMHGYKGYFNDYIIMMRFLVSSPKDAEILIQNEILGVAESESLTKIFDSLDKDCVLTSNEFRYSGVVAELQGHCRLPIHKWKATLKQNYFNTPWASISVIAAVLLLLLTITQTVCNLIAL